MSSFSESGCQCNVEFSINDTSSPDQLSILQTDSTIQLIQQVDGTVSREIFEYLLRSVRFTFDPSRPDISQYSSLVEVTAYDGLLTSAVASTHIVVSVINQPPRVLFNGTSTVYQTVFDGEAVKPLFPTGTTVTVLEDSLQLSSVSITLSNPQHPQERLTINETMLPASLSAFVSADGSSITLSGLATPADYVGVLMSPEILYHYPPIESILQGEVPDLTPR